MNVALIAEAVFWTCAALVAYAYVGYPVAIWILSRTFGRAEPYPSASNPPRVTLLVAAHDEERHIEAKLRNALESDYPPDRLEVVVASDGSRDRTAEIVRGFDRVRLFDFPERRGKSAVLNDVAPRAAGDVVVFSDANTFFGPGAVRRLARWFADPTVGVVCGRLILTDPETGRNADSLYWRYETFLKKCEARLGALLGANGAIYAIRRDLYVPMPDNTIVDDFVVPLLAKLRHGCRIIYDAEAAATEETPPTVASEFRRRSRIGTGGYQSIALLWRLLDPRQGWTAFAFLSHKILRWAVPFLLAGLLLSNAALLGEPAYRWLFAGQAAFYGLSAVGARVGGNGLPSKLLRLAAMFSGMNAALLVGFWKWLTTKPQGTWQRTSR